MSKYFIFNTIYINKYIEVISVKWSALFNCAGAVNFVSYFYPIRNIQRNKIEWIIAFIHYDQIKSYQGLSRLFPLLHGNEQSTLLAAICDYSTGISLCPGKSPI